MFQRTLLVLLLFLSSLLVGTTSPGITSSANESIENDNLNREELLAIFSLIPTSNLQEIFEVMAPTTTILEETPNPLDLLLSISSPNEKTGSSSQTNIIQRSLPKTIFTNNHSLKKQTLQLKQTSFLITDNKHYVEAKQKTNQKNPETDEWKDFRWEQWEEKSDPLAHLKTPPYVDGFGELKAYSLQVNADNNSRAYALKDDVYKYLTRKIKEIDFQIDYRFNLLIQAKISDEAEVYYNVSQEPDMPQKTDVSLRIRQTWVKFGYSDKKFQLGSFTDVNKKIDGVSVEGSEGPFTYNFSFGSEKSKHDTFTRQGDGGDEYELRNKPVLEKSVQVWVNDQLQIINKDYSVNYFEGKIIFVSPKNSSDTLRFSYQYTNPIEEFIPIASNINMLGFKAKYDNKHKTTIVKKIKQHEEIFESIPESGLIQLKNHPLELDSVNIYSKHNLLEKNVDYYVHYSTGVIVLANTRHSNLKINYLSPETKTHQEHIKGNGEKVAFYLQNTPILNNSEKISLQGNILEKNSDYKIENEKGMVVLKYPIPNNEVISMSYRQLQFETKKFSRDTDLDYDVQFAYIRQFAKSQKDINTKITSEKITSTTNFGANFKINLQNWPILDGSVSFMLNDSAISTNALEIDNYTGTLTVDATALYSATGELQINYSYYKEFGPQQWNFSGSNKEIENYIFHNNILAHRIKSNLLHPIKYDPQNQYIKVEYKQDDSVFKTLLPGLDYDVVFNVDPVKEGQIYLILYHERNITVDASEETVVYGLPANLSDNDLFKITYYYTNSNAPDAGEIVNEQFAIMYNQQLANNFGFSAEVARSHKEYTKQIANTTDILSGTGEFNKAYSLSATNIVENSETVYINGNVAIRDMNYYINYNTGQITFIQLNLGADDNIRVEYSYYTKESGGESEKHEESGNAIAIKTNYKDNLHDTKAELIIVDDSFDAVGSSKYSAGSNIIKLESKINPSKELSLHTELFTNKKTSTHKSNTTGEYLNYNENKYKIGAAYSPLNIFSLKGEADIQSYATEINKDNNLRPVDKLLNRYMFSLSSGPSNFKTNFMINNFQDFDKSNKTTSQKTIGKTLELNNDLVLFSNNFRLLSSFRETTELKTSGNQELSDNSNKKYSFDVALRPFSFLKINGNYIKENLHKKTYPASTQNVEETRTEANNYGSNVSFSPPINLLILKKPDYNFNLSNTEQRSLISSHKPDASQTIGNRLSFGIFDLTSLSLKNSFANSLQSNNQIKKNSVLEEYTLNGFSLFKDSFPITLKPFSRRFSRSSALDKIGNSTTMESNGKNNSESTKYGLAWEPIKTYKGSLDYSENKNHSSSTENKSNEIIHFKQSKPNTNLKINNNLELFDFFKTNHSYEKQENQEQKFTYHLTTSDLSITKISTFNNISNLYSNTMKNILFQNIHPVYLNNSFVHDNFIDSAKGIKLRNQANYEIYSSFKLLEKLTLNPKITLLNIDQYSSISDNYTLSTITSLYDKRILNNKLNGNLNLSYPFLEKTNLLADVGYESIHEDVYNKTEAGISEDPKIFNVYSIGVGMDTTIIPGLFLKGTYTFKNNQNKKAEEETLNGSHTLKFEGNYKPSVLIALDTVENITDVLLVIINKSTISFFLEYNQGKGINSYTVEETENLIGKTVETKIEEIDNLRIKGSFESIVEVPLIEQSNGMIEKFVFNSEAHIVIKNDYANDSGINYTIFGLILSGKLVF